METAYRIILYRGVSFVGTARASVALFSDHIHALQLIRNAGCGGGRLACSFLLRTRFRALQHSGTRASTTKTKPFLTLKETRNVYCIC